jgi:Uma2 family endonuclease
MAVSHRWSSTDLELFPEDGKRREIIDGELFVSTTPHANHQATCGEIFWLLHAWEKASGSGRTLLNPGLIFADDDDVVPDIIWISNRRHDEVYRADGRFHGPPELVVEVLSPGSTNERRDREAKLKLYSRRGVDEYWIVNWRTRTVEIFRRIGATLSPVALLTGTDGLTPPLLPGFEISADQLFVGVRGDADLGSIPPEP